MLKFQLHHIPRSLRYLFMYIFVNKIVLFDKYRTFYNRWSKGLRHIAFIHPLEVPITSQFFACMLAIV